MTRRFVNRQDKDELIRNSSDFKVRYHGSFILWVTYAFIASILAIILIVKRALDSTLLAESYDSIPMTDIVLGFVFLVLVMVFLAGYIYLVVNKIRSFVQAAEFQNLMFSSAMKVHTLFCFIANNDKKIVYADNHCVDIFKEENIDTLDDLLKHEGISEEDSHKLLRAISNSESEEVPLVFTDSDGEKRDAMVFLDPIERPTGYFIVRGY